MISCAGYFSQVVFCLLSSARFKFECFNRFISKVYVLAMLGNLTGVSLTFAQIPIRITNVEFAAASPAIANTMLPAGIFFHF